MKPTTPYGAGRNQVMKKLVTLGMLVATVAFAGTAFADTLQGQKLQGLFDWSAQAAQAANQATKTAGPGAQPTKPVPSYQEYRGSDIR